MEVVQVATEALFDIVVSRSASGDVQVVPVVMLDSIVSRSTSRGSKGSTRGLVGQYCQ